MNGNVALRAVDRNNWNECIRLDVKPSQIGLVGPNVRSLAEAYVRPESCCWCIYENDRMVGFIMYLRDQDSSLYYIHRFMVDKHHQGKGIGKAALRLAIEKIRLESTGNEKIMLLFLINNTDAERFYRDFGFVDTGTIIGDEKLFYFL